MQQGIRICAIGLLCVVFSARTALCQAKPTSDVIPLDKNVIVNGGFEKMASLSAADPKLKEWQNCHWDLGPMLEIPESWGTHAGPGTYGVMTIIKGAKRVKEGNQCLKLTLDKKEGVSYLKNISSISQNVIGKYRFSLWAKGRNVSFVVAYYQYDAKGGAGYAKGYLELKANEEWTEYKAAVEPTRSDIGVMLFLITVNRDAAAPADAEAFLYLDDIRAEYLGK